MYSSDETVPKSKVKEKVKTNMSQIILASASPRRKELLEQIGAEFVVCPAKGEEIITEEEPSAVVMELSRQKAEEVASGVLTYNEQHAELVTPQDILVIGADTVVAYENQILGSRGRRRCQAYAFDAFGKNEQCLYRGNVCFY